MHMRAQSLCLLSSLKKLKRIASELILKSKVVLLSIKSQQIIRHLSLEKSHNYKHLKNPMRLNRIKSTLIKGSHQSMLKIKLPSQRRTLKRKKKRY